MPSWTAATCQVDQVAQLTGTQLTDVTLRQGLRLTAGGKRLRIVLSNAAGDSPLRIASVRIATAGKPGTSAIDPSSNRAVTFAGRANAVIQPGAELRSDAIELQRASSVLSWYQLAAIEVDAPRPALVAAVGDSITDGSLSRVNANGRWPDRLAERLAAPPATRRWAVANQGIAGNRLLDDGGRGPSVLTRFDHMPAMSNLRAVILSIGVNDLCNFVKVRRDPDQAPNIVGRLIDGYRQLIRRAHRRGVLVVGGTIPPFVGSDYAPTAQDEAGRQEVNRWVRIACEFDAVIDWDALLRSPTSPDKLDPRYDSGDHIHPSPVGYRVMGHAIPLSTIVASGDR